MSDNEQFNLDYYKKYYKSSIFHRRGDQPFLYRFWIRYIRKLKENGRLLDIGCGEGYFLKRIQQYFDAFGSDISQEGIYNAKTIADKTHFVNTDASHLPYKSDTFDIIVAFDLIEHLRYPAMFIKEAFRTIRTGGILIIKTPNPNSFGAKTKGDLWYGKCDKTHISIYPLNVWKKLLKNIGFNIVEDGTDTLWDSPYFKIIPAIFQRIVFIGIHKLLTLYKGFYHWKFGENYICIVRKKKTD